MSYQHILFAADFSEEAMQVGRRAKEVARLCEARLSLIHVVEDLSLDLIGGYELIPVLPELPGETLQREARATLGDLAQRLNLADAEQWVVSAPSTKQGILDTARQQAIDLIVVGSHGRHGLALLLGSTANAVLHGAECDVLAVRIRN
jgi:universal stress protein A